MRTYLAVMLTALLASVLLTPVARRVALKVGAVGGTGGRNVHAQSIPRLGGVAITLAWCITVVLFLQIGGFATSVLAQYSRQLFGAIAGGVLLCVVGAVDDIRGLRAVHKLFAQILVAAVAFACGFRIDAIAVPYFGAITMGDYALPITTLWIVGITNAVNLIDGLDGLAAGVAFFAALTSFAVAHVGGNPFVCLTTAALMGVLAGFLFFNFNPARIFMGDSGSYFIGYALATLSLIGAAQQKATTVVSLFVPMIALGLPIFDTLLTMVRRFLERRPLFSPDRGHIHHRLLDIGLTHRRAVMLLYCVCIVFTASAIAVSMGRAWQVGVALLSVSAMCVALVRFGGSFQYLLVDRRQRAQIYDEGVEQLRYVVPRLLCELAVANTEQEVFGALREGTNDAALERVELEAAGKALQSIGPEAPRSVPRELLRASFPLGRDDQARAGIRFYLRIDRPDVPPQVAVLLQLLVDAIAQALTRAGSKLAPEARASATSDYVRPGLPVPSSSSP